MSTYNKQEYIANGRYMFKAGLAIGLIAGIVISLILGGVVAAACYSGQKAENTAGSKTVKERFVSLGDFELTAYCPCASCCGKTDRITASGTEATAGRTVAADTSILPFGTEIYINGHKYTVEDRGGAIKGNRLDIYFDSHEEARMFGRRTAEVFILNAS